MKRILILLAGLLLAAAPQRAQTPTSQDDDALYAKDMFKPGESFPTASFGTTLDGKTLSVKDFKGKYLVLDFWATWCPDCRKDVPALVEAYRRFASDKVAFVSISWDQDRARLEKYMQENGITWTQVCDFKPRTEITTGKTFHVRWIPSIYIIGPDGRVLLNTVMLEKATAFLEKLGSSTEGLPMAVAHRGCWLREHDGAYYIPENSPAGVAMAARFGYPSVECDVRYTRDSVMVIMHDGTINRTMRNAADYSRIQEPVRVSETTFAELREKYVLESSDPALRTPIPTLEEYLRACKQYSIIPMLHSAVVESYALAQKILGDKWIAFDANQAAVEQARKVSDCLILLDPGKDPAERTVDRLTGIGGWCGMSTMGYKMLDAHYIRTVREAGFEVQASIFPAPHEQRAVHDAVSLQLSDFWWYQTAKCRPVWKKTETKTLQAGESQAVSVSVSRPASDFEALTLALEFSGTLELTLTDWRSTKEGWRKVPVTYTLHRDMQGTEYIGLRLYKSRPEISVKACENPVTVQAQVSLYSLLDELGI